MAKPITLADLLAENSPQEKEKILWILQAITGLGKGQLILGAKEPIVTKVWQEFSRAWQKVKKGWPLQYAVGKAPFRDFDLLVNRHVLIPRPETEGLVDWALELSLPERASVLDVGVGSGAIVLSLALARPRWDLWGSDLSSTALVVARKNAKRLGIKPRFHRSDLLEKKILQRPWDLIVSNPPYLDEGVDEIQSSVWEWEPKSALVPVRQHPHFRDRAPAAAALLLEQAHRCHARQVLMELSPRVIRSLIRWLKIKQWAFHSREDLAGRTRYLLIDFKNG